MRRKRKFAVSERAREHRRIRDRLETDRKTVGGGVILVLWGCSQGLKLEPPWCWVVIAVAAALGVCVSTRGYRAARRVERELAEHRRGWSVKSEERAPAGALPH